ncbi:unnamed protein product [Linum trigynum]|uniref:Uncharacterized protein n=1 Tax=Linum trigynum TaxID=586398 RepID=A0AAV2G7Y8_9ROSI
MFPLYEAEVRTQPHLPKPAFGPSPVVRNLLSDRLLCYESDVRTLLSDGGNQHREIGSAFLVFGDDLYFRRPLPLVSSSSFSRRGGREQRGSGL